MHTQSRLSLAQAPPISVPLRYFLTAPLFGVLAAGLLLGYGPDAVANRWTPQLLGATHLMTLGFISMTMLGALSQMVPVLAGIRLPRPRLMSAVVHTLLTLGALMLACALLLENGTMMRLGISFLGISFGTFIAITGFCLIRAQARSATVAGMRLAVIALAVTVVLGVLRAVERAWSLQPPLTRVWTDIHMTWGLLGWVTILVISVSFEVVPMFQMTPFYPEWVRRWVTKVVMGLLVLWTLAYAVPFLPDSSIQLWLGNLFAGLLALGLVLFVGTTLYLQHKRRRRLTDVTLQFWRIALLSLFVSACIWLAMQLFAALKDAQDLEVLLGALFIVGFVVSVIYGMLYKIVPFLIWLHLQEQNTTRRFRLPNMKDIIPDRHARRSLYLHLASVLLLVCAVLEPAWCLRVAALTFVLSFLYLAYNLYAALGVYRKVRMLLAEQTG